ncbi:GMC family oxidoreductase [Candidatus Competibacter phosphatis]|uniref:GMC family oxidoreductase n=1 Tax=Candidatus Competibacter phosphatis TaxID=221280 RepID=A0ABX1TIG8_9GAMM|nr:GMC family oxidoreductase [Candidatus Competibacter phosphatis]NMQ19180.1 GMC family oxidoreductase [Candidatus Competibacter phosphatis]
MIYDALDPSIALDRTADIAIVGSGPAGITLARVLGTQREVLLLEAGGSETSASSNDCLAGEVSGLDYPLNETRARQFGGATALWAGYCAVFDQIDFEARPWVSYSGWPFDIAELTEHYPDAAKRLHIADACFDLKAFEEYGEPFLSRLNANHYHLDIWRFGESKADFARENRDFLDRSYSVHVLTNGCVISINLTDDGGSVSSLSIHTLSGASGTVRAKYFILAAGGIETPRLMLASRDLCDKGVGNAHDHVGRWFMEHPHVSIEGIEMAPNPALSRWTGVTQTGDGRKFTYCAGLRPDAQARLGVLNARAHFYRTPAMAADAAPRVGLFFEQAPNPASRLTLTNDKDGFGLPRVCLHWDVSNIDRRSHRILGDLLADDLIHSGSAIRIGPIHVSDRILYSNHQLGTTRMSKHPRDGVVDENCKVHGIDNLYIAGGSVFPTVSWANPTVTVLALTLRLAWHLVNRILRS